ncbi:trafficking protein particle complex subunit 11-like isoform X2 [Dreissena polymorpha]|nr:trafficking protein particle complex subunit 11-like isoform X2 [Dreissena polymorpha]
MSWANNLPEELTCRPTGLVILTGLDVTYNAVHKSIWDSFYNNRRLDRVPLQFQVVPGDHEYPKCRTNKRQSYEWYIPKGILKSGWMKKHLTQVPAVAVMFFDLDWDDAMWKEKQMECSTRVEIVRNSLQGRGTKVSVVLIQKNAPLPPGEDVVAAERAASLCSACELSAKHLYVLPQTDHLIGYTIRLENAFYELSQAYYHGEARKVKSHKDFLNKTTHQLLFVRHQFKIAFFNELKQDTHTAIKHYKQAYGHILELRMNDTNMLEVKTIAGFVNYKICRLSFQHNAPLDGIAQFRKHIDFFKGRIGVADLAFEHSAWMSKQFQVFGDLFDEAIKLGLTAIQTQHPGFYYQHSADYAIARKQLCRGSCKPLPVGASQAIVENIGSLDFYGQRPWRQGHQSIDPPDLQKERDGIAALQALELLEEHSWLIIPLLNSAVAQFKKYKSLRMKRFLMVQMGQEYFHARDYQRSIMLLSKVTWDYRVERWWPLLTSILMTSLKCAYLTGKVQDYVINCVELIGPYTTCSAEEKTRIQMNLLRVMSNDAPEAEPGLDAVCVEKARHLWTPGSEPCVFNVEMQNIVPCVECKARFTSAAVAADEEVTVEVYIRVRCPFPVRFSKVSLSLNNPMYNQYLEVIDGHGAASEGEGHEGNLYLVPGMPRRYTFSFLPVQEDVGNQLEITGVCVVLGSETARCGVMTWVGAGGDAVVPVQTCLSLLPKRQPSNHIDWNQIQLDAVTKIVSRPAQLDIGLKHQAPSLLNEFYLMQVTVTNREDVIISNVSLSVTVPEKDDYDRATHLSVDVAEFDGHVVARLAYMDLESLAPGESRSKSIFVKCLQTGIKLITFQVDYSIEVKASGHLIPCACSKVESVNLNTVSAFEVSVKIMNMKFETIEAIQAEEPFLLMPELKCIAPWAVNIQDSDLQLSKSVVKVDKSGSQLIGVSLEKNECAAECYCLSSLNSPLTSVSMGSYVLHWKRRHVDGPDTLEHPTVTTLFSLPTVSMEHIPLSVDLQLPAYGNMKCLLPVRYLIHNRTGYPQEIEISMEASESFMFSGNKQIHFRLLPGKPYELTYNLFPLVAGHVSLPKMHLNMVRYSGTMDAIVQKMLPSHVFIKPFGKKLPGEK